MKKKPKPRFDIDFTEFCFLVEACIPPRPLSRICFWYNVIDKYYHVLTLDEREKLFEWINDNTLFEKHLTTNEDCQMFNARYDPCNQYIVTTLHKGKTESHLCFKWQDRYHTTSTTRILEDKIIKIERNALEIYSQLEDIVNGLG